MLGLTRPRPKRSAAAFGQAWVTDETNETDAYARNRLRHAAVPALRSINGGGENLARFCEKAARADAYFARPGLLSEALLMRAALPVGPEAGVAAGAAGGADALILEAALHSLVAPVRDAEEKYMQLLCAAGAAGQRCGAADREGPLLRGRRMLWQETSAASGPGCGPCAAAPVCPCRKTGGMPCPGAETVTAGILRSDFEEKIQVVHKKDLKNRADYARITTLYSGLVLRTRQPGDVSRLRGEVGKPLRKWMNEAGIPAQSGTRCRCWQRQRDALGVRQQALPRALPRMGNTQILHLELEQRRKTS